MTYEQSVKLCEHLRNTVSAFDCEIVFFDFKSAYEYEIIFIDKFDIQFTRTISSQKERDKLPCAFIFSTNNECSFHYSDQNIDCEYNLYTGEIYLFESYEEKRSPCSDMLRLEFAKLKRLLSQK